jgi:hypothetical protein
MTRVPSGSGSRKKIGCIHSPDSLADSSVYDREARREQGGSKEVSGRESRGAPDEGTSRVGWRGVESIWSRRQTRALRSATQRHELVCPRSGTSQELVEEQTSVRRRHRHRRFRSGYTSGKGGVVCGSRGPSEDSEQGGSEETGKGVKEGREGVRGKRKEDDWSRYRRRMRRQGCTVELESGAECRCVAR